MQPLGAEADREVRGYRVPGGRMVAGSFVREAAGPQDGGPPVVLLHGLGATAALNWFAGFDTLGRRHRVIAPDIIGHGRTRLRSRFQMSKAADRVAAVLDELGTGPCIVVGYSMGGAIAQLLAHRRPDLVSGLVLCATSRDVRGSPADRVRFGAVTMLALGTRVMAPLPMQILAAVTDGRDGERWWAASELAHNNPACVLSAADALGRFTSRAWVGNLRVPSTVILTKQDNVVPPSRQAKLASSLRDSKVVRIDGDHLVCGKAPARFAAALRYAVDDVERRVNRRTHTRVA